MMSDHDADEQYPGRLLQQAAIYNNIELMDSLLQGPERQHVNAQDPFGRTALYTSITNNSYECSERLLLAGADANIACGLQCGGMSPMHAAALDNKDQFVCLLLAHRADVNRMDASGERPLALALKNRSTECILIIREQLEMNQKLKDSIEKEFCEACGSGNLDEVRNILQRMILSEEDVIRLVDTQDLLHKACENGHLKICELLLEVGVGIKLQPATGYSPLHVACVGGHAKCVSAILKFWPNQIEIQTLDGSHPIHLACIYGHLEVVKILVDFACVKRSTSDEESSKAVALDVRDGHHRTPLHVAVANNRLEIVEYILNVLTSRPLSSFEGGSSEKSSHSHQMNEKRVSGDVGNGSKRAKTEKASCSRQLSKDLLNGIDVDVEDGEGKTSLHFAVLGNEKMAYLDVAAILLQHRADPNKPLLKEDGSVSSPLMEAFRRSDRALMELLLRYSARDDDLQIMRAATETGDDEMIGVMIQHQAYLDLEYRPNYLALVQSQHKVGNLNSVDVDMSRSMSYGASGINISWHSLGLKKLSDLWVIKACGNQLKKLHACPDWVLGSGPATMIFLTRIDISKNNVEFLPTFLFELPSLRLLNASDNKISGIGKCAVTNGEETMDEKNVDKMTQDKRSSINFQSTEEVFVLNCPSLEEINLSKNQFAFIPSIIFQLPSVKKLNLSHNVISGVSFEMWTCTSLLELNLSHNKLEKLPSQSESSTILEGIPTSAPYSTSDHRTSIFSRRIDSPSVSQSESLVETVIPPSSNNLHKIPVASQPMDQPCDRPQNYTDVPPKYINRWQEKVQVQPSDFESEMEATSERRSQLLELNLAHNSFDELPAALPCLAPQLEKLVMSHNRLTQIGLADAYPASLKSLDLSGNQIDGRVHFENAIDIVGSTHASAAARICHSPFAARCVSCVSYSAQSVILGSATQKLISHRSSSSASIASSWNPGACKHRSHHRLEKLRALKLDNNKIRKFVICTESPNDQNFTSSDESERFPNDSKALSPKRSFLTMDCVDKKKMEVLYPSLTSLDLSHNEIVNLPSEINELTQLAELKISYNKIKELPPEMGLMRKLWNVDFSHCPVSDSLRSILGDKARKTSAVLGYLKSIRDEAVPFNRMKLMFVGIQGIGKTSLLNQLRDKKAKHSTWGIRMHKIQGKDQKGDNISTVGVDISDLEIQGTTGKVIFSTWDFGGQKEYYATHQYFLSKRSLYLVVWKVTDGEKGVNEIMQWLINIQARVPGSPVIIVGTHMDQLPKNNRPAFLNEMGRLIDKKYIYVSEPDKQGLPRVVSHIEVSCKSSFMTKTYIPELRNLIWKVVSEETLPGSRGTRLLEQKVPARYLHLQVIVETLAQERKAQHKDPVLHADQYKHMVIAKMEEMFRTSFQDMSELSQATQFLHENGVLLHYDEVNLQDVYFLDPQWLCDMLASIITIREINSFAKSGVMKTDDMKVLFKGVAFKASDIKTYMINLLQKFEVALLWDHDRLLIPSLLPTESDIVKGLPDSIVMVTSNRSIPVWSTEHKRSEARTGSAKRMDFKFAGTFQEQPNNSHSILQPKAQSPLNLSPSDFNFDSATSPATCPSPRRSTTPTSLPSVTTIRNPAVSIVRLYLMSYFPCGFWPRLITRLLGDKSFLELAILLYESNGSSPEVEAALENLKSAPRWQCWQTGLELKLSGGVTILRLKEVSYGSLMEEYDYSTRRLLIKHEQDCTWSAIDARAFSVLEIFIPNEALQIGNDSGGGVLPSDATVIPNTQVVTSLLTTTVDRIDTLLEDWYPDIGIRFTQNTKGIYLITRLIPCFRCLFRSSETFADQSGGQDGSWAFISSSGSFKSVENGSASGHSLPNSPTHSFSGASVESRSHGRLEPSIRTTSCTSPLASPPRNCSHDVKSLGDHQIATEYADGVRTCIEYDAEGDGDVDLQNGVYCFLVEYCLQAAQLNRVVSCPVHGNLGPFFVASSSGLVYSAHIASDTIFQDIGDDRVVDTDMITWGKFLGRGAFGAVFAGSIVHKVTGESIPVAMKVLQPVKPNSAAPESQLQQYKIDKAKWDRDPVKNSCEAYLNARKELGIMLTLKHPHIVPLLAISIRPLSLILSLAPQGALRDRLLDFERAGTRVPAYVICDIIIQVASALQYLHSLRIIYRDLKSENVLVWSLPLPHAPDDDRDLQVAVKLADYGVSRVVLPVGTKGFAGTLPFMAPEIIQHNGEEMYTEKVDCYSFGMFIYELLLLKLPFEDMGTFNGTNINLKGHVMSGGRPMITAKEVIRQSNVLDLMTLCWSRDPSERPSAKEIVEFAKSPEFCSLYNVVMLENAEDVLCACSVRRMSDFTEDGRMDIDVSMSQPEAQSDVWVSLRAAPNSSGSLVVCSYQDQECVQIKKLEVKFAVITVMCVTTADIWCASSGAMIHVYRQSEYREILKFSISNRPGTSVRCMSFSQAENQMYVVLDDGHIVVCSGMLPATFDLSYSPVQRQYPCNKKPIHCIVTVTTSISATELWCGQERGKITIWSTDPTSECIRTLNHFNTEEKHVDTFHLVTSSTDPFTLYSYVYPGTTVYCWDTSTKSLLALVNLVNQMPSRLLRGSGLQDSSKFKATQWQVTCMNVVDEFLYIGTTGGCLVVISKHSMTPLTVCQLCGDSFPNISVILPLSFPETPKSLEMDTSLLYDNMEANPSLKSLFVTIGKGYRNLASKMISRYSSDTVNDGIFVLAWSGDEWPPAMTTNSSPT